MEQPHNLPQCHAKQHSASCCPQHTALRLNQFETHRLSVSLHQTVNLLHKTTAVTHCLQHTICYLYKEYCTWRSGGRAPNFDVSTGQGQASPSRTRLLCPLGNSPQYSLKNRISLSKVHVGGHFGEDKYLSLLPQI